MPSTIAHNSAAWSYTIALLIFAIIPLFSKTSWRGGIRGKIHIATCVVGVLWAGASAASAVMAESRVWAIVWYAEIARMVLWLSFAMAIQRHVLHGSQSVNHPDGTKGTWVIACAAVLLALALSTHVPAMPGVRPTHSGAPYFMLLGMATLGLFTSEAIFVATVRSQWWSVKPFCVGFAAMMGFDVVYFSGGAMLGAPNTDLWNARGVVHGLAACVIALSASRLDGWQARLQMSGTAAVRFWSASLVGLYLILISGTGYAVAWFGGDWGGALAVAFSFAALLSLLLLALSTSIRSRLKIFLSKHILSYRYDYRYEWRRFTDQFGTRIPGETHLQQLIRALGDLTESHGGQLWARKGNAYQLAEQLNSPIAEEREPADSSFIKFLSLQQWVVNIDDFKQEQSKYSGLHLPAWLSSSERAWLIVPLLCGRELEGFAILDRANVRIDVDWEVRDILKTAGSQIATHLAEMRVKSSLIETEKFAAFNKMSAFVVHDLKNLVAQLDLMLRNADRHKENAEFQADMLGTVRNVVSRMQKLMLQMGSSSIPVEAPKRLNLAKLVARSVDVKVQQGAPISYFSDGDIQVFGHYDRLERVIGHLIQNSIDATAGTTGQIAVKLQVQAEMAVLEVSDNGIGMSEPFLREQLFRPFQSTKPHGMGIGVYESDSYVRSLGGNITVRSAPFAGTTFRVEFPRAASIDLAEAEGEI